MLLKCMHADGHTTYDKVDNVQVLDVEVPLAFDDNVNRVYYPDPITVATVTEAKQVLVTRAEDKGNMLVRSQYPMYLMNDDGKTIEVIKP